jgi:hypothetical protein
MSEVGIGMNSAYNPYLADEDTQELTPGYLH